VDDVTIRSAIATAGIGALLMSGSVLSCAVTDVDLGNDRVRVTGAGGSAPDAGPVTISDCPALTEAQAEAFYGTPCASTCADSMGPARVVKSSAELEAVISGRWQTCAGDVPWTYDAGSNAVGIQFQAGCTVFLLYEAPGNTGIVEGVMPDDQGTFNVLETTDGTSVRRSIELFFPSWTWIVDVATSDCAHGMTFTGADGGTTRFSGFASSSPPLQ
jgi:hypothetical protein